MRVNLLPLLLRQWRRQHQHQNLSPEKTRKNLILRDLLNQNQFAGLQLVNPNPENSSRRSRNRIGYPNLFDRLTPKQ